MIGVQLQLVEVRDLRELETAFAAMGRERQPGLLVLPDPLFLTERRRIAELVLKARLPTGFARSENVDKILKGAKPVDLPVQQPTKFELVINPVSLILARGRRAA